MRLEPGAIFAERYRVERCIASGAMGAVYEVTHLETERRRALKVMRPEIVSRPDLRERFRDEARVAARIDSEFVVDVFDAGVDANGVPFLVMDLLVGEPLSERVKRGALSSGEALLYLRQAARALDKSHQARIVHRDLKPENLFVVTREDGSRQIKVLDFGIAKILEGTRSDAATRSLGTPLYMAPEQFHAKTGISAQTDVFALGMLVFTLVVGSPYWLDEARGETNMLKFVAVAMKGPSDAPVARAARRGVALPAAFDAWFARATAAEPTARFASAGEAITELARLLEPHAASLPPPSATPLPSASSAVVPMSVAGLPVSAASAAPTPASAASVAAAPVSGMRVSVNVPSSTPVVADAQTIPIAGTFHLASAAPETSTAVPAAPPPPAGDPTLASSAAATPPRRISPLVWVGAALALAMAGTGIWLLQRDGRDRPAKERRRADAQSAATGEASAPARSAAEPRHDPALEPHPAPQPEPAVEPRPPTVPGPFPGPRRDGKHRKPPLRDRRLP